LIDSLPLIIEAGVKLFISLIENLPTIIIEIVKALPQIIVAIVKGIVGAIPQLISAGADLIKGLWQGIVGMGTWLWDKIKGFFKGITDKIKDFFGIKSPSKVFAGLGKMIPAGFAAGVKDAMPQAISDIEAQFAGVTANVSPDVRLSGGAAAGGNVVNIYPQSMTEAQFDYIYAKMNARLAT
jgi:phage-related protein